MQVPKLAESGSSASYAELPEDPSKVIHWVLNLPETYPFADLQKPIAERLQREEAPEYAVALGFLYWRLQEPAQALALYEKVLPSFDHDATFHLLRGMAARKVPDQHALAQQAYERALELEPQRSDAYYNLGNLYREERPLDAERCYRASINLMPEQPMAWHNYGILLVHDLRLLEARDAFQLSLKLDPSVAAVWCNLALALFADRRMNAARLALHKAVLLEPALSDATPEMALSYWEQGGTLSNDSVDALWDLALISLAEGDYRWGWRCYEIRFSTKNHVPSEVPSAGSRLRTLADAPQFGQLPLLVWSEQGLGDAIQFGRYLFLLKAAGIPFEFRCRKPLLRLFQDWYGFGDCVVPETNFTDLADNRFHCSLLSLPHLFGSELHTLPKVIPYIRPPVPTPEHLRIPAPPGGLSIGLVWAANPDNKAMYRHKSVPLRLVMPRLIDLIDFDLIDLHVLQFGKDNGQLDPWRAHERITDWTDVINDFSDTAHVLQQLDLVITVDTAVAHLSGALNRATWLLLPRNCDFRWLLDRQDSPWYCSALTLFRQPDHGDWDSVVSDFNKALDNLFLLDLEALKAAKMAN